MRFFHHPDGLIYIEQLQLPLDFFLQLEPEYSLPSSATHREYRQGKYHRLYDDENQWGGEFPWKEGDRYLSKVADYQTAWNNRQQ